MSFRQKRIGSLTIEDQLGRAVEAYELDEQQRPYRITNVVWLDQTTRYTFDVAERLDTLDAPGTSISNAYHGYNGLLATRTETNSGIAASFTYDVLDQLDSITWKNSTGDPLLSFDYSRNPVGLITNIHRETGDILRYQYDDLDRLTNEVAIGAAARQRGYDYDLVGNRLTMATPDWTVTYTTNYNRLTGWSFSGSAGAAVAEIPVQGHASETIGSVTAFPGQYVSNLTAVTPSVAGTNFTATIPMGAGEQMITASIAGAKGRRREGSGRNI